MDQQRSCLCGCGTPVREGRSWARGHAARGQGGYQGPPPQFPGPDDLVDVESDAGELIPDEAPAGNPRGARGRAQPAGSPPLPDAGSAAPDEPPAHARREWRHQRKTRAAPPRVTNAIRADIDAKISFALEVPGRVWQARDPVCGGVFVGQRAEISGALTDIVCQSADLVKWFTGPGGNFMLFMNLAAAAWPVATVVMAHHVYHSIEAGPDEAAPDYAQYAA
jgi:hypothetical protein